MFKNMEWRERESGKNERPQATHICIYQHSSRQTNKQTNKQTDRPSIITLTTLYNLDAMFIESERKAKEEIGVLAQT